MPVELIPGVVCAGVFVALAASGGGYAVTSWGPAAVFLVGLLLVVGFVNSGQLARVPVPNRVALGFLAVFVCWNFLSIAWAEVKGIAWDGANRTLLYLVVYAIFSVLLWRPRSAWTLMGLYSVALGLLGTVELYHAIGAADPSQALIGGRFAEPTNYPNAVAALFIGGFWPAMFLSGRREVPWPLRGMMLAIAGLLVQLVLLPQSRGSLIVLPIGLLIYLAVVPNRLRALIFLILVALATGLASSSILDVFSVADAEGDVGAALGGARDGMLVSFVALLAVGTAVGFADSRLSISNRIAGASGRAATLVAAVAAVAALGLAIAAVGNPIGWAGDRWDDFKGGYDSGGFGSSRFSGDLGSNRYDFWRVAIDDELASAPLIGDGSDNFAVGYLEYRESAEEPLYPHSLPIRILAGTGLVGALLFVGFLVAAAVCLARARRATASGMGRGIVAIAIAAGGYLALHSSGDWLWSFPGIAAPIFAWLGLASRPPLEAGVEDEKGLGERSIRRRPASARITARLLAVTLAAIAVASLVPPWLAARDVQTAATSWGEDRAAALDRLDRARGLNPLSAEPDITAGAIAAASGDRRGVEEFFMRALEREPTNWYALLEVGAVDAIEGRRADALETLGQARALNPNGALIVQAIRRARMGNPLTLSEINDALLDRVCRVVGKTDATRYCK